MFIGDLFGETFICALKSVPFVGRAVEVIDATRQRRALAANTAAVTVLEARMSRFERQMRPVAAQALREVLADLSRPVASAVKLDEVVRELRAIREEGFGTALFQGLFAANPLAEELRARPGHFGRLLEPGDTLHPDMVPVFVEAGGARILEVAPGTLRLLLAQQGGVPPAGIVGALDLFAVADGQPAAGQVMAPETEARPAMVYVPAGTFQMGSPGGVGDDDEWPRHGVTLSRPLWMAATPVTQAQWRAVMNNNPSGFEGRHRHPVERVSWFDAVAYCNALSRREGATPGYALQGEKGTPGTEGYAIEQVAMRGRWHPAYRLPTEAEWEHAARAGTETAWWTGDDEAELERAAWFVNNASDATHPVAELAKNDFGLYDVHGNVLEWVWDWYGPYAPEPVADPTGPPTGPRRVGRGGSWIYGAARVRSANRDRVGPGFRGGVLGFRVSRPAPA